MIQTVVIAIPGIAALIECILLGPERALLDIYLPVLLLLPQLYSWPLSGQLSFADTAILPIAIFFLFGSKRKWHWNTIDFLIITYIVITAVAEGVNKGYKEGFQNLALQESCSIFLPYFAARQMFQCSRLTIQVAKRIAECLTIVAILSIYEFRMGQDLFTALFQRVFPLGDDNVVFRAGFMRTQGPYGHAITLGIVMAFGFRIARWLEWNGGWNDRMPFLPISKIRFCEIWIVAGSIMSLSVGPWLAATWGAVVVSVCRARNRKRALVSVVLFIVVVGAPIYSAFKSYVSVDPAVARASGDRLQEDSAYRNKLMPLYVPVVEARPSWGWGRNGFPVLEGMESIDNAYLFTALVFGVYALCLQVALFVWPPIRLGIFALPLSRGDPRALAAFSIMGMYVLNVIVDGTGSGTGTPWRMFFIIAGWSAAVLSTTTPAVARTDTVRAKVRTGVGFRRVMV
jgi:hypothetical protein